VIGSTILMEAIQEYTRVSMVYMLQVVSHWTGAKTFPSRINIP